MPTSFLARLVFGSGLAIVTLSVGCGGETLTGPSSPNGPVALKVSLVNPSTGASALSTSVRIVGTGFESGATLKLDDVETPVKFVSSTALEAIASPHAAGPIDVVVTNPGGQSSRLERGFTYVLVITSLTLTGNSILNAIGETSQLTATAAYSDGTTADVTKDALWTTSDPTVVTVSTDGVLTARGLGRASVALRYPATAQAGPLTFRSQTAVVTPVGTFTVSGWVRQPGGTGGGGTGGLGGVLVRHVSSGASIMTEEFRTYSFTGLTDGRLSFSKADFEPVQLDATPNGFDDVPMQRVVRIEPGTAPEARILAPNDMAYDVAAGTRCEPCKLIRILSETTDTVQVRLTWTSTAIDMHLWVNGEMFPGNRAVRVVEARVPVTGGSEAIVYVGTTTGPGSFSGHQPYTLTVIPGG